MDENSQLRPVNEENCRYKPLEPIGPSVEKPILS